MSSAFTNLLTAHVQVTADMSNLVYTYHLHSLQYHNLTLLFQDGPQSSAYGSTSRSPKQSMESSRNIRRNISKSAVMSEFQSQSIEAGFRRRSYLTELTTPPPRTRQHDFSTVKVELCARQAQRQRASRASTTRLAQQVQVST